MQRAASTVYRPPPNQTPPVSTHRYSTPSQAYQSRPSSTVVEDARHSEVYKMFAAVDTDQSGSITVRELQRALVNGNWTNFDLDTCKMLMNMTRIEMDLLVLTVSSAYADSAACVEFVGLWKYISDWQHVFRQFDRDSSGSIDGVELAAAFRSFGYNLSPTILMLLEQKYCESFQLTLALDLLSALQLHYRQTWDLDNIQPELLLIDLFALVLL
ncbi:hypothetical protein Clacol_006504 [Clathrus columnatus]|uniref:EF-hand domain-containing protein n=1 Tax=Clathrus columnatus TaxID=1419009 RepID=A0AAV5AGK5_9AGAM|nr:hypothetical protein Clacol_006504 [Clathrus columnatus]